MKRVAYFVLLALAAALLGWAGRDLGWFPAIPGLSFMRSGQSQAPVRPGQAAAPGSDAEVVALGRLTPRRHIINIGAMVGDRVDRFLVEEHAVVEKGQTLAYLDSHTLRELELKAVQAQLKEAQSRRGAEEKLADTRIATAELAVEQAKAGQLEINAQEKKIEVLKAALEMTQKDLARVKGLSRDIVSDQQNEQQVLAVQKADAELKASQALLQKAVRMRELGIEAANADLRAARATKDQVLTAIPVASLQSQLELIQAQLDRTVITAPCRGTILKIHLQPGELIGPTPVMQIADLTEMDVVAEVYETDVQRVRVGQPALVASKAFAPPFDEKGLRGKVARIDWMVARRDLKSLDPLAPTDRRIVEVVVELDPGETTHAAHWSNLQVDVRLLAPDGNAPDRAAAASSGP